MKKKTFSHFFEDSAVSSQCLKTGKKSFLPINYCCCQMSFDSIEYRDAFVYNCL